MALSVFQFKNLRSNCLIYNKISALSITQYANNNQLAFSNDSIRLCQSRSFCNYLTPKLLAQKQINLFQKLHNSNRFEITNVFRQFSTHDDDDDRTARNRLPTLMEFPKIIWPSFFKMLKNVILVNFIIKPYFDREFNMTQFSNGAKHAMEVVSSNLASAQLQSLDGLVTPDALMELKRNIAVMSADERSQIAVKNEDIYFYFPYQVGIIFDESSDSVQKRFVEITMVFHVLKGLKSIRERGVEVPLNAGFMPEFRDKMSVCNYRFIKQFTQGNESDWTVNLVNHFRIDS